MLDVYHVREHLRGVNMDSKNILQSKTFWINLLTAASAFLPGMSEFIDPKTLTLVLALINIALRVITNAPVKLPSLTRKGEDGH